jgi:hypothetical protein
VIFRSSLWTNVKVKVNIPVCWQCSISPYLVVPDLFRSHMMSSPFRALVRILLKSCYGAEGTSGDGERRKGKCSTYFHTPMLRLCSRCQSSVHCHPRNCETRQCDDLHGPQQICVLRQGIVRIPIHGQSLGLHHNK